MFKFDLVNKALTDTNVSETEFRTLYLIANNCSMNNTDSIEMYNAYMMDKLHYSESTIKRCTKALEQNGYISIKRATKKKTPNIITLTSIKNERTDETTNAVRNEVTNDTLYNNIDNNIDNIQSIQSNTNEDNGIPYDVYCEQQLAKEKEEREKNASYDFLNLVEDNFIVGDNTNEVIHSTDPVNDNLNEDSEIDYEVYEEPQIAKESTSYENLNNFNVDNGELQGIRGIDTETDNPNEDNDIDATIEAYERDLIEAAEQSSIPQQQSNTNSIDWDKWRERFEKCKIGMLNAKCMADFNLWKGNCNESLKFAKEHMRHEKYEKQRAIFEKWYAASAPHFFPNKQKQHSTMQGSSPKPSKIFDDGEWYSYKCELEYIPEKREETARKMVQYLEDCGKSPKMVIEELKTQYGITL